ncbi:MAG TPA: CsbD family protein [Xanthobacteraceae bacterium]|jgi:uncharacterized protein YjbJ (UPF0337 family)
MDENRLEGTARDLGAKVQEGLGRVTRDAKSQAEGMVNQVGGKAKDLYGQAAGTPRDPAGSLDSWLRDMIETRPYTAAIVALGIGWLLGRLRRTL